MTHDMDESNDRVATFRCDAMDDCFAAVADTEAPAIDFSIRPIPDLHR